jgi:hypothetical protein
MTAVAHQTALQSRPSREPSLSEIRRRAASIRRSWSPIERDFRREVGEVQRRRLAATLLRAAA